MVIETVIALRLAAGAPAPVAAPLAAPALALPFGGAPSPLLAASAPPLLPAPVPVPSAPLDLSPAAGVYERRGVGLLVLDAKDSTALHLSEGTRRAHALIRDAVDGAAGAASAFDGRVSRRLGDGSLIAFPTYAAALGAAEAIQRENAARAGAKVPKLRVGVHAGRVLVDATGAAPEIYGRAVEKTLALAASADGGAVAVEDGAKGAPSEPSRAPDAPRPVDSVRVELAATMFASLDSWTTAYERYGRRRSYAAVKAFHAFIREAVERRGGAVVKPAGETVRASFPTAEAGVKAAADIQARLGDLRAAAPLGRFMRARVGLSWGRVIREERAGEVDYFGNTVNAAARLMKLSGDGEALISGTAAAEPGVSALLEGASREKTRMKGFDGEITVARLKPAPSPRDAAASSRLRETARKARAAIAPAPDAR